MPAAPDQPSSYRPDGLKRDRVTSVVLAVAITVLIVAMLIRMGALGPLAPTPRAPTTIQLLPDAPIPPPPQASRSHAARKKALAGSPRQVTSTPVPVKANRAAPHTAAPWNVIPLTNAEFAATDVSKMTSQPKPTVSDGPVEGRRDDSPVIGQGPDGTSLYAGDWYRRPTTTEMHPYIPARAVPGDWGEIICRTTARYHVEDCREVAESPPNSGIARGFVNASWQFLFRPPRVDGRALIGVWIRFRVIVIPDGPNADR